MEHLFGLYIVHLYIYSIDHNFQDIYYNGKYILDVEGHESNERNEAVEDELVPVVVPLHVRLVLRQIGCPIELYVTEYDIKNK